MFSDPVPLPLSRFDQSTLRKSSSDLLPFVPERPTPPPQLLDCTVLAWAENGEIYWTPGSSEDGSSYSLHHAFVSDGALWPVNWQDLSVVHQSDRYLPTDTHSPVALTRDAVVVAHVGPAFARTPSPTILELSSFSRDLTHKNWSSQFQSEHVRFGSLVTDEGGASYLIASLADEWTMDVFGPDGKHLTKSIPVSSPGFPIFDPVANQVFIAVPSEDSSQTLAWDTQTPILDFSIPSE